MAREKKFFVPIVRTYKEDISKRWRVEYWEPERNGYSAKRVCIYGGINRTNDPEERLRRANEIINQLPFGSSPLVREKNILERVIESGSLYWRDKTTSAYKTVADRFKLYLKKKAPETATEDTVNDFLLTLYKEGVNKNTISKYRNTLYTLYSKAIAGNMCTYNPVKRVAGIKRQPRSLQFFSDMQIQAFKAADIDHQLWLAIQFLFYCFIRPGEQRHMKISWINFEHQFIDIPGEYSKNGKSQKVAVPGVFFEQIQYLKDYPNNFYVLSKIGGPGHDQISTKWLNNSHRKVLDMLKIRGHYAFYSWKHTGVVKAVKAGINIKDLQLQLRHHSLDMVNEYLKNLGVMDSEDLRNRFPEI